MLQYEKIDVSEGIDVNKTSASKEFMLFSTIIGVLKMFDLGLNHMFAINVTIY